MLHNNGTLPQDRFARFITLERWDLKHPDRFPNDYG